MPASPVSAAAAGRKVTPDEVIMRGEAERTSSGYKPFQLKVEGIVAGGFPMTNTISWCGSSLSA